MRISTLSDQQIMSIMHEHDAYRKKKQEYDERYPSGRTPVSEEDQWVADYFNRPLMSDEEFLEKFRAIVPAGAKVVTTPQVVDIFNLRSRWQFEPPIKYRNEITYTEYTMPKIRLRVGTSRAKVKRKTAREKDKDILIPLSQEELRETFSIVQQHGHWFPLEKVLRTPLGRQQRADKILFSDERPPNRGRGRPPKEEHSEQAPEPNEEDEIQRKVAKLQEELDRLKA